MKCVCGYSTEDYLNETHKTPVLRKGGDKDFIKMDMKTLSEHFFNAHVPIFACPKCGTLKTDVEEETYVRG